VNIADLVDDLIASIYPNRFLIALVGAGVLVALVFVARRRGWHHAARRHPWRTLVASVAAIAILGPLGWYLGSPLFISTTVDEPAPIVAAGPSTSPSSPATPPEVSAPPSVDPGVPPSPAPSPTAIPLLERSGTFRGEDDFHFGEGTARLIETEPGTFVIRLEDFRVRNGPDLFVYLSPSADGYVEGALEVGRLKADRGNQNYQVPAGADVQGAATVVIWCKQFSVQFATALLG
jgi:hypothetical protein